MLLGQLGDRQRHDPWLSGMLAMTAAAVWWVRARLLVTQIASCGISRATAANTCAALQSQSRSLCP